MEYGPAEQKFITQEEPFTRTRRGMASIERLKTKSHYDHKEDIEIRLKLYTLE
jgi:hypothetical protein